MKSVVFILALSAFCGPAALAANCVVPNSIVEVRNQKTGARETVEFKIKAPLTGSYTITAGNGPTFIQDGSGDPITVGGNR